MRKLTTLTLATALIATVPGLSGAADCHGTSARTYASPVVVTRAQDGTVTTFTRSTGTSTILAPKSMSGTRWQHCSGILVQKDRKLVRGDGVCYAVTPAGDRETYVWTVASGKATWKRISGTGVYKGKAASGVWSPSRPLGGLRVSTWKGTCE